MQRHICTGNHVIMGTLRLTKRSMKQNHIYLSIYLSIYGIYIAPLQHQLLLRAPNETHHPIIPTNCNLRLIAVHRVSRQLVYGHFVYDTSSTDISSTDVSSTMAFLAQTEAGVMKRILYQ